MVRGWQADLVITLHDDCPGHPDNRAAGRAVRDAIAFCTTPNVVPEAPVLARTPLCLLMTDYGALKSHRHEVVVDVDETIEAKLGRVRCARHAIFSVRSVAAKGSVRQGAD